MIGYDYDVVICGGGMAALLMARHLQLYHPGRSILIIEKEPERTSPACLKVGESIAEGSSYYLRHTLALGDYLFSRQLPKFGLRFFFGGGKTPLAKRLEYGGTQWPPFATFQLDRGVFECDLRRMVIDQGATILARSRVTDIELGEGAHRITAVRDGETRTVAGRWVIDATGRRRLLTSKLGLRRPVDHQVSASWWHLDGRIDLAALVGDEDTEWHQRTGPPRWYSTIHLAGEGYWVWVIPLLGGKTSIGIVADEEMHPIRERASLEGTLVWCREHEPGLAELMQGLPILDFKALKNLPYLVSQIASHRRWSCVGDAAVFADPLYALAQDHISHEISITSKLIELDFDGRLTEEIVAGYNRMFFSMFELILEQHRSAYATLGSPFHYAQKLAWDSSTYFGVLQQTLSQNVYDNPDAARIVTGAVERLAVVNRAMQRLFLDSLRMDGRLDILAGMRTWAPRVTQFADASLDKCAPQRLAEFFDERLQHLDGIAASIFIDVIRHSPSLSPREVGRVLKAAAGIDPRAASMRPERWEADGLFDPSRPKPDLSAPAQWDVNHRIQAERRDYRPIQLRFHDAAVENHGNCALIAGDQRLTYGELLAQVERLANVLAGAPGDFLGVAVSSRAAELQAILGILFAGKAFVVFDPDWDHERSLRVRTHFQLEIILTDEKLGSLLQGAATVATVAAVDRAAREAAWAVPPPPSRPAFGKVRFTVFGPIIVSVDHAGLFRLSNWLPALMRKGLPLATRGRDLRCLWAGPGSVEMIVPLLLGCPLRLADPGEDGPGLRRLLDEHPADIVLGRPVVFQALLDAGWSASGARVVSVGEALSPELSLRLRSTAARMCDFGYATFAH
jgi:flavin-dependent dehydrogenase